MNAPKTTAHGPEVDTEFFEELHAVFQKFPDTARKYAVRSISLESRLDKDMQKHKKIYRVEGNSIVAEFRATSACPPSHICCEWVDEGSWRCYACCPAFP